MTEHTPLTARFAPSPTGFMHVGGVRTALYAWLFARKNKGRFILRIEDTDKEREVEGSIEHIIESLKWLGIDWDEGPDIGGPHQPYIQSERLALYRQYAEKLVAKGLAYADPYSEAEMDAFHAKADEEKRPFLYRDHRPENPPAWDGSQPLRLKVTDIKRTTWPDLVRGELGAGAEALDDFILIKSDGYPTYNFAHVVDDIEMGVTHVMRGQEFISSTPKFLSIYQALDVLPPLFATMPPILAPDGKKKLGKRDGAKDILEYRKEGYLPEAMINFLALLGWNPGDDREVLSRQELIDAFDVTKVQHGGARLNEEKLSWLNKEHMKLLPEETRMNEIKTRLLRHTEIAAHAAGKDDRFFSKIYPLVFDRISVWGEIDTLLGEGEFVYFFAPPTYDPALLSWKGESKPEDIRTHLTKAVEILEQAPLEAFDHPDTVKNLIFDYATEVGRGQVLWPIRFALSGREKSPDPFTLIFVLGKEESLSRIRAAIKQIS